MTLLFLLLAALSVMLVSLIGAIFIWKKFGDFAHKNIHYLVSFSAGVFFIVAINLTRESWELSGSYLLTFIYILIGIGIFLGISFLFPESHHHHEKGDCCDDHTKAGAKRMIIGDAIHNMADGIILAPAFLIDIQLGIMTTLGILIHEGIQEISEFFVLKDAGYTTKQALIRNVLASSTILIGASIGFFVSSSTNILTVLLGIASGVFLYIVIVDLVPKSVKASHKDKKYFKYILWALFGILLIWLFQR